MILMTRQRRRRIDVQNRHLQDTQRGKTVVLWPLLREENSNEECDFVLRERTILHDMTLKL